MAFRGAQHDAHSPPPPPTARQSVTSIDVTAHGPTSDVRRDDPPMRSCHLALALIGTTLHGALALDRRPAISIRPSSRSHDILRGGAGNKHPAVPPLVQGRVKTIRRCIMASNVISCLLIAVAFISVTRGHHASLMHEVGGFYANPLLQALEDQFKQHCRPDSYWISDHPSLVGCQHAQVKLVVWSNTLLGWPFNMVLSMPRPFGMYALLALAWSTVGVFKFVAQRLLRACRPREFDQACVEMSQTPQRLLDLVLSITRNVVLVLVSRRAISGSGRRA